MQDDQNKKPSGVNPLVWVLVALVVLVVVLAGAILLMLSPRSSSQVAPTLESTATNLPSQTSLLPQRRECRPLKNPL